MNTSISYSVTILAHTLSSFIYLGMDVASRSDKHGSGGVCYNTVKCGDSLVTSCLKCLLTWNLSLKSYTIFKMYSSSLAWTFGYTIPIISSGSASPPHTHPFTNVLRFNIKLKWAFSLIQSVFYSIKYSLGISTSCFNSSCVTVWLYLGQIITKINSRWNHHLNVNTSPWCPENDGIL